KFERILTTCVQTFPRSYGLFRESMITWLTEKFWVRNLISDKLEIDPGKVIAVDHHASHAASAFYTSPFEDAAILTVDGVGEWATAAFGVGNGHRMSLTRE